VCSANENASRSVSASNSPLPDHEQQVPVPEPSHMESSLLAGVSALAAASKVPVLIAEDFTATAQAVVSNLILSATVPPSQHPSGSVGRGEEWRGGECLHHAKIGKDSGAEPLI